MLTDPVGFRVYLQGTNLLFSMKRILGISLLLLIGIVVAGYFILDKKLPEGRDPAAADALARKMLEAVNDSAWQATGAVTWTFMGSNEHLWDRERNLARVHWNKYEVLIDLNKVEGVAWVNGERVEGKRKDKLVKKAWKYWVNDSFWLNPVSKLFDEGTTRYLVDLKYGRTGLMVTYSTGGNTPGDSYVWLLDENYRPVAWKMWVSIIPIGGLKVPWTRWTTTETGAVICTLHDSIIDLKLTDVHTAPTLRALTDGADPFAPLF